jgi:hypothetical protein
MRSIRSSFVWAAILAALLVPSLALGAKSADAARAEALFAEGRKLMSARDYAAACPKFADSQALEPAPGTALNLAICYEKAGKLASAWAAFKLAQSLAQTAGQGARVAAAKKKAAALEPQLSRLTIVVPASSQVTGLEVRCDEEAVHEGEWGVAVPRDGGSHDIEAVAPGKKTWTTHIELERGGQSLEVAVPTLEDVRPPVATAPTTAPPTALEAKGTSPAPAGAFDQVPENRGDTQQVIGLVVGGIGVAGLAFGAIAGVEATTTWNDSRSQCGSSFPACPQGNPGFALHDKALNWATASTIGLAAGGGLLAGGVALFFTAPKGPSQPTVGVVPSRQGAGLAVQGTF